MKPSTSSLPSSLPFRVGSWALLLTGIGHLLGVAATQAETPTPEYARVWGEMQALQAFSPGAPHTLADFYLGNTWGIGAAYVAVGVLAVILERTLRRHSLAVPLSASVVMAALSFVSVGIAVAWFPAPPIALFVVASVAFTLAVVKGFRSTTPRREAVGDTTTPRVAATR